MPPVTCVLSAILGNRIFSALLADSVDRCVGQSRRLWFESKRYHQFPAPLWLRRFSAHESAWVARRWLSGYTFPGIVVVNGFTLALACSGDGMIVATDATPAFLARNGGGLASRMVKYALGVRFRRLVPRVSAWLPMSATVAQSLIGDYGVEPGRCFVTRAPQPLIDPQSHAPTGDILFVGNDFERKGGFDLLTVFERKLLPEIRLAIASNDPVVRGLALPGGVRLISGVTDPTQLAQLYRQSDLLVLPTHSDCYSLVVCEAAAQGVPSLATRVGGIGELLDESGGLSLPRDSSPEELARHIREALGSGYLERSRTAGRFAREKLPLSVFDETVRRALGPLAS
jgi:glycosyltransferase involved in cell wall biosynthesis